jgi:hypothetical protein
MKYKDKNRYLILSFIGLAIMTLGIILGIKGILTNYNDLWISIPGACIGVIGFYYEIMQGFK